MSEYGTCETLVEPLLEALNMGRCVEDLLASMHEKLVGVVPFNRIGVAVLDEAKETLRAISCRSDGPTALDVSYSAPVAGSTLQHLLATGEPRIINDLEGYLAAKPESVSTSLIVQEGMRSSLTLPLLAEGKPIGVVFFSCREKDAYAETHVAVLKPLAGHIAIGLEKAQLIALLRQRNDELAEANRAKDGFLDRLREEVQRQTEQLRGSEERYRTLVRLGRIVNSSLDLRQVFRSAAEEIHKLLACDRVSLLLLGDRDEMRYGFALEFAGRPRWLDIPLLQLPGTAARWVVEHRQARFVPSLERDRLYPEDQRLYDQGYRAYVYLPLVCRQVSVGVLGIASRTEDRANAWNLELLGEWCDHLATALDNAAAYGEIARLKAQLEEQNVYLRDEIKTTHDFGNIVGDSAAMRRVRGAIAQVAKTDSTVLILGETGTGKELLARAIHESSPRSGHLLVKVNCAALAPALITSELFGHEAGAFTGATGQRQGRFELAQRGSIFLDEIAEVPPETQVMMLRVLQERAIERVGGSRSIPVDVRVIAATNRDLKKHVDDKHFRADLFYRLNVFPILVPALRERREDIPALIDHFLTRFARQMNKEVTRVNRRTMELLMNYQWPGNVRELENIIERAMIISRGDTLEIDAQWLSESGDGTAAPRELPSFAEVERQTILDALQRCRGRVYGAAGAAALLKLKPTTLYGKMRKHRIARRRSGFEQT
jgi:formate hydrogenlyase transcriptional activator